MVLETTLKTYQNNSINAPCWASQHHGSQHQASTFLLNTKLVPASEDESGGRLWEGQNGLELGVNQTTQPDFWKLIGFSIIGVKELIYVGKPEMSEQKKNFRHRNMLCLPTSEDFVGYDLNGPSSLEYANDIHLLKCSFDDSNTAAQCNFSHSYRCHLDTTRTVRRGGGGFDPARAFHK